MVASAFFLLLLLVDGDFKTPELWDDLDFGFDGSGLASGSDTESDLEPTTKIQTGLRWYIANLPTIISVDFGINIHLNLSNTAKWNTVFFSKNLTKIYEPLAQIGKIGHLRQTHNNIVLPINATVNPTITQTKTKTNNTLTDYLLAFRGDNNVNPFYGTGLYVNWTRTSKGPGGWSPPLYDYYFQKADLGETPLSHICLQNCYCHSNQFCGN